MKRKPIGWLVKGRSIVLLGLDFAGKSTLVSQWTKGVVQKTVTTIGLDIEHVEIQGEKFNLIDLGGQQPFRITIWKTYAQLAQGVIFVFDVSTQDRLAEAVEWFWKVVEWLKEDAPIIFCANKIDLRDPKMKIGMTLEDIIKSFQLEKFSQEQYIQHSFRIFEISAKTGENVEAAMEWIFGRVIGSGERVKIHGVILYSIMENKTLLELPFRESFVSFTNQPNLVDIVNFNYRLFDTNQSVVQFYEQLDKDTFVFARDGYICLIVTDKNAEYNSIRITGESILSVVKVLEQENHLKPDFLKWVIKESFGA